METVNEQEIRKRPQLLTVFLIMSMLNGILSVISNLLAYMMIDVIRETFEGQETINFMGMELNLSMFINTDKNFFLFQGLLFIMSFAGALLMWNYKKTGFHFYTLSQILLLIVASVFIKGMPFPYFDVILTGMFIYVYANNLKIMQ